MSKAEARLEHYKYFGTTAPTISSDEKAAGIVSAFPAVYENDDLPPVYDSTMVAGQTKTANGIPSVEFQSNLKLEVKGQGTIAIKATAGNALYITLSPTPNPFDTKGGNGLHLDLTDQSVKLFAVSGDTPTEIPTVKPKGDRVAWLNPGVQDVFWLSIDKKNGILRYGKTYRSAATTYLAARVDTSEGEPGKTPPGAFAWIRQLQYVSIGILNGGGGEQGIRPDLDRVSISPLPICSDLPPVVAESIDLTLEDLAVNTATSIANLEPECRRLYENIAGPGVKLDDKSFPDFSQALEYSIRTPGKMCYERLREKAKDFGGDPTMTYLRITLGSDEGNSPGVPYVVEIWPSKHRSPIHDHGDAYAVIKVLHGEIMATYFTTLDNKDRIKLEPSFTFHAGQVTWIGPENYQVHQLHNESDRVCVTIQCYQYAKRDRAHDEFFEYIEANTGEKKPFNPDSDWDFIAFKKSVKEEWEAHLKETQW